MSPLRRYITSCAVALLVWGVTGVVHGQQPTAYIFSAQKMGTEFEIVIFGEKTEENRLAAHHAARAAWARADSLNARLSDYLPESELNRLSATAGSGKWVPVSDDLWAVLVAAQTYAQASQGAFDVTVGPLTRIWRHAIRRNTLPNDADLAQARRGVGFQHLQLDSTNQTVLLSQPSMRLDLGGIAKGFAADEMLEVLVQHGFSQALVDAGGDIRLGDAPPLFSGWRLEISDVDASGRLIQTVHFLSNSAVATSGDRYRNVEADGIRYSHILDPRTGMGVTHAHLVTVIAPTGMAADALASTFSVLGATDGVTFEHATSPIAVRIIERLGPDGPFQVVEATGF